MILGTKIITTVFFYGYAREGIVVIPVFALLLALLADKVLLASPWSNNLPESSEKRRWFYGALLVSLALIAIEGIRWSSGQVIRLDGVEVHAVEPFPATDYQQRRLRID
jgi:hypothetical protein